ncbi:hypothetical protein Golax_010746, partial [Gossypium laxum]|nr:hypothetical protein [Gossypium laxum]
KYLCQINRIIPLEIWPSGRTLAPWDIDNDPLTHYQEQLKQALKDYQINIPDPKEWSQEYPMYCSQLELKHYRAKEEKSKKIEELNLTSNTSTDYDTD